AYARHVPGAFPWVIGMIAATGFILVSYVTKEFKLRHQSDYPHDFLDRVKHRDLRVLVIAAGAMVGFAFEALWLVGVLSHAVVVGIMVRGWRGHSVHPTPPIRLAPAAIAPTTPTRRHLGGTRYLGEDAGVADTTG
ncbi:MAG: hypothetical protein O7F70_04845, partial [Gemmatimonadetes bacterium]|nr:hypothetical protein [Gemmatimonadota bacterium]